VDCGPSPCRGGGGGGGGDDDDYVEVRQRNGDCKNNN